MTVLQALIYGIVQGLGEFLPISSTAHIIILPWLFNWSDPGLTFDVALHLGTLFAVIMFFWRDWIKLIKAGFTDIKSVEGRLFWFIMIACIPGGVIGVLFNDQVETSFRNPALIGVMLIVMGIILYIADKLGRSAVDMKHVSFKESFLIGVSQAIAIIPGVSRSGITMAAGRTLGLTRETSARFTFLLSTPFIFLSGVYKLKDMKHMSVQPLPFSVAVLTSAVVGALSIKFLLDYLKKKGFGIFTAYRIIAGVAIIAIFLIRR